MICKKCGYAYTVTKSNTKAGRHFQCSGSRYSIKCKSAGHSIYADVFEDYVLQEMKKQLAKFQYLSDELETVTHPSNQTEKVPIAEIEQEIGDLFAKVPEASKTVMEYINRRIEELDKEKQSLQKKLVEQSISKTSRKMDKITNYIAKREELDNDDKQRTANCNSEDPSESCYCLRKEQF